ncbi:MAG TPA: TonB-dependent receptor, partial [Chitinophagaceae bacterium]|nr:TonB-dependent receptor [Chitinophagaceae bacterium]
TSGKLGNPDLEAERSFSYEAGADYFVSSKLKIAGTFFQRFYKKLIDYAPTAYADIPRKDNIVPNGVYALARNIAEVNTTGAELDIQYHRSWARHSLYAGAGLVWLDSKSSDTIPSFYISSHAKFMTNFFIEYGYRAVLVSVSGVYKDRAPQAASGINARITKDYFVLNTKLACFTGNRRWSAFVQLDNIFDTHYSDLLGAVMPGRWLSGGVNFNFSK